MGRVAANRAARAAVGPEVAMARKDRVVASLAVARVADPAAVTARRARVVVAAPVMA